MSDKLTPRPPAEQAAPVFNRRGRQTGYYLPEGLPVITEQPTAEQIAEATVEANRLKGEKPSLILGLSKTERAVINYHDYCAELVEAGLAICDDYNASTIVTLRELLAKWPGRT